MNNQARNPTLADVFQAVTTASDLTDRRRKDLRSSLKRISRVFGQPLEELPLAIPDLACRFDRVVPIEHRLTRKSLINLRSACSDAIAASGLLPGTIRRGCRTPLSEEWQSLWQRLTSRRQLYGLSRFAHWCSRNGIPPSGVSTETIVEMMADIRRTSLRQLTHKLEREIGLRWNEVATQFPELALREVTSIVHVRKDWLSFAQLSESFQASWREYESWATNSDPFDAHAPSTRRAKSTLLTRRGETVTAVNALVKSGYDPMSLGDLSDLVTPEAFRAILTQLYTPTDWEPDARSHGIGIFLISLAKEWVKIGAEELSELKRLHRKVPKPRSEMSNKSRMRIEQFDDAALLSKLLDLPQELWEQAKRWPKESQRKLALAQSALAIQVEIFMALRVANLAKLRFDDHVVLRQHGRSVLRIPASETKNKVALEYDIPTPLVRMLLEYRGVIAPRIMKRPPDHVFCKPDGQPKSIAMVRLLISRPLERYLGIEFHPHAFRHLAAKLILDEDPGAHVLVQHLLGHQNLQTTATFYAGLNTRRAGLHHSLLLERALAKSNENSSDARRRASA